MGADCGSSALYFSFNSFWDASVTDDWQIPDVIVLSIPSGMLQAFLSCGYWEKYHTFNSFWDASNARCGLCGWTETGLSIPSGMLRRNEELELEYAKAIFQFLLGCFNGVENVALKRNELSIPSGMLHLQGGIEWTDWEQRLSIPSGMLQWWIHRLFLSHKTFNSFWDASELLDWLPVTELNIS